MSENFGYLFLIKDTSCKNSIVPKKIILKPGILKIGRGSPTVKVDILLSINDNGREIISRNHAEIIGNSNGTYQIHDLGALNGVFVNNVRIDKYILRENDIVQFGGVAKVPIGIAPKVAGEHASYLFSMNPNVEVNSSKRLFERINRVNRSPSKNPETNMDNNSNHHSYNNNNNTQELLLLEKNKQLSEEVEKLKQQIEILSSKPSVNVGTFTSPISKSQTIILIDDVEPELQPLEQQHQQQHQQQQPKDQQEKQEKQDKQPILEQKKEVEQKNEQQSKLENPFGCLIDYSALQELLKCSICNNLLLDAVVCRCSHGFCRACIETYFRSNTNTKSNQNFCPNCVDENPSPKTNEVLSDTTPTTTNCNNSFVPHYYRSGNLDGIIYLLQQASSEEDIKNFNEREKEHHKILKGFGLDPELSPLEEAYSQSNQTKVTKVNSQKRPLTQYCEYCGEEQHEFNECPYETLNNDNALTTTSSGTATKYGRYGDDENNEEQNETISDGSDI